MILDCTLRDGGYYTNWEFDNKLVQEMVLALDKSGVDYIELGYKSPVKGGRFRKCNDQFIFKLLKDVDYSAKLAFMIDTKDFLEDNKINEKLLFDLEVVKEKNKSPFSLCRLATNYDTLDETIELVKLIKKAGYETTINLMKVATLKSSEVEKALKKMGNSDVDIIYVADSLGSLYGKKLDKLFKLFKETCKKHNKILGFHPHNNLGLSFPNTLQAEYLGTDIVDGTVTGMGRGAGNLRIEQYLMMKNNPTNDLLDFIQRRFVPLKAKNSWGWNPNYMYSGMNEIHPSYPQELQSYHISDLRIQKTLQELSSKKDRHLFNREKIHSLSEKSISVVIPARYKSSRFPGKPIIDIDGTPMIIRVADIAAKVIPKENIYIATEDSRIASVVDDYDYNVILTSDNCLTGTDRVCEAAQEIDSDIIINIQGDEPLLNPDDIQKVIDEKLKYPDRVINCFSMLNPKEASNRNIPKVVFDSDNNLVYMSRSPIPGTKSGYSRKIYKQVCIYGFTRNELLSFYEYGLKNGKTEIEWKEDIEILRFLEIGTKVRMLETFSDTQAVDIEDDVEKVLKILNKN
tara:strand:- start:11130 stop:12845 length:1716 start_codon:yes stop_codon:yes gene_type:complete